MRNSLILLSLLGTFFASGQENEKDAVRVAIETFFAAFHMQDTLALANSVSDDVMLQTISKDSVGTTLVVSEKFNEFARSISSIPKTTKFEEKLKFFAIQVDGLMANAWVPYEFWLNNEFHHCGVNSFQLVKFKTGWKIVYLIDTRRKEDCA